MKRRLLLSLSFLLSPLLAQEEEPEPPAPAENEGRALFSQAILAHKNAADLVAKVRIKRQPAQGAGGMFGGNVVQVLGGDGGAPGEPFEGEAEIWRGPDGATVVVSAKEFPGFGVYVGENRTVRQVTFDESPPSLAEMEAELVPLLDPKRLAKYVMNAELSFERDEAAGKLVFEGDVSRKLVKVTKGEMFMPQRRVLKTQARLVLSAEGRLEQVRVRVVHNDPMREMMRDGGGRLEGIVIVPGGKVQRAEPEEDEEEHDIEGDTVVYTLDFSSAGPSERAKAFRRDVRRMLDEAK